MDTPTTRIPCTPAASCAARCFSAHAHAVEEPTTCPAPTTNPQPLVVDRYQHQIDQLSQSLVEIEDALKSLLLEDPTWAASYHSLASIPGVGVVTAAWLLTATVNFTGCATAEQAVAYAGLAPHPRYSGTNQHRHTGIGNGGHVRLRTALYMATLSAAQHNPVIRTFYRRLLERGKPHKVARCAAARKLLLIAWAVVTKQQMFDPSYEQSHSMPQLAA